MSHIQYLCRDIMLIMYICIFIYVGKSPMIWKNLDEGKYVVTLRATCVADNNSKAISVQTFKFRVRNPTDD